MIPTKKVVHATARPHRVGMTNGEGIAASKGPMKKPRSAIGIKTPPTTVPATSGVKESLATSFQNDHVGRMKKR